jgi:hypothetical protein
MIGRTRFRRFFSVIQIKHSLFRSNPYSSCNKYRRSSSWCGLLSGCGKWGVTGSAASSLVVVFKHAGWICSVPEVIRSQLTCNFYSDHRVNLKQAMESVWGHNCTLTFEFWVVYFVWCRARSICWLTFQKQEPFNLKKKFEPLGQSLSSWSQLI